MVLDIANADQDSLDDKAPASDEDPYSSSDTSNGDSYHIDVTRLPRPIPLIGPLLGMTDEKIHAVLATRAQRTAQNLKRPLTQEETDALAYWGAKQMSILSYGRPVGCAMGVWRAWNTAGTFRFPMYQPNLEKFNPHVFPARMVLLQGPRAVLAWHILRGAVYGWAGSFVVGLFNSSYATTVSSVGLMQDKRLRAVMEQQMKKIQRQKGSLPIELPGQGDRPGVGPNLPTYEDDASPTGGLSGAEESSDKIGELSSSMENKQPVVSSKTNWPSKPWPTEAPAAESKDRPFSMFDDASPTGGEGMQEDRTSTPRGSSWDRLRRGQNPASEESVGSWRSQQIEARRDQKAASGQSFSISKSEQDRNYAKEEAQSR